MTLAIFFHFLCAQHVSVLYTTSCKHSLALPRMGEIIARNRLMIEIINKPLLLHLVGYIYYWQIGFNSVFKGLSAFVAGERRCVGQLPGHQISTPGHPQQVQLCADDVHSHNTELHVRRPAFCHHTSRVPYVLALLTRGPCECTVIPRLTKIIRS